MGQSVEVVVSELTSASARLADAAQRLTDGLSSVDTQTTQLMGSGWKGGAASAYAPAWEQWHSGAEQVVHGLQRMSELLPIAGKEYAKTDESVSDALGSTMQGAEGTGGSTGGGGATDQGPVRPDVTQSVAGGAASAGGAGQPPQPTDAAQQAIAPVSQLGQEAAGMVPQVSSVRRGPQSRTFPTHSSGMRCAPHGAAPFPPTESFDVPRCAWLRIRGRPTTGDGASTPSSSPVLASCTW